jgi:hypothetical protein
MVATTFVDPDGNIVGGQPAKRMVVSRDGVMAAARESYCAREQRYWELAATPLGPWTAIVEPWTPRWRIIQALMRYSRTGSRYPIGEDGERMIALALSTSSRLKFVPLPRV